MLHITLLLFYETCHNVVQMVFAKVMLLTHPQGSIDVRKEEEPPQNPGWHWQDPVEQDGCGGKHQDFKHDNRVHCS